MPTPAVTAMARAPQKVTRSVARQTLAPPARAPTAPSRARNSSEEALTAALAQAIGVDMTEEHWQVIRFLRNDFKAQGATPTIRRVSTAGGVDTKKLFQLFPKKPAKKMAYIAGLPKPAGCV